MRKIRGISTLITLLIFSWGMTCSATDLTNYVDPFIGVEGGGNIFPGPCIPFGMVKLGPDCGKNDWNAGWDKDGDINGFSHTHVSGTGGGCKYGNILVLPLTGNINLNDYSSKRTDEKAVLGEYSVTLSRYNTKARLTALKSSGFHEYTFPASKESKVLIDLGSFLQSHEMQQFVGSEINILSNTEVEGYSRIRGGWNEGGAYTVYFYAQFDTPANNVGTWKDGIIYDGVLNQYDTQQKTGAFFNFITVTDQKIKIKLGISYISTGKAKANMQELNSWNFEDIKSIAKSDWEKVLGKIKLKGNEEDKKIFYTALYHSYLQPVNKTGENPKWKSEEPNYDDFYCIWDTFRATHPLFTLLTPSIQTDMLKSLIDIYKHEGYMPDARSGNDNGRVQGGTNSDILIADAILKGIKGIDYESALKAMIKNAETAPGGDERKEGRGGLSDYNSLGYVSTDFERAGSRTLEYSYCDFEIAIVAKKLNKPELAAKYFKQSENWKNLWNDNIESLHHKGFIWPRDSKGNWQSESKFNVFSSGTWPDFFYETFSWELSFYVPHDVKALIEKCGGKDKFMNRLDTYFTNEHWDQRWFIGMFQVSNEPGFLTPTLYNYINRPDKTSEIVRKTLRTRYNASREGIPGNDDSGAMSAWYVFHALGFYPNAGQDVYLISGPVFEESDIKLENGKTLIIKAKNTNDKNIYIQSAKLNGRTLNNCWLKHSDIGEGGLLEFVMGKNKSNWAENGLLPPSLSDNN